jgi:glyoxylase-like metal-dependent hydrolase (beta-lactamase superfamily II)
MPELRAATTALDHGVIAVDTDYVRPVFDASHIIVENGRAAFVDTGTHHSVPLLLDALLQHDIDVGDVDYLFVTHVHLDHAGGAGSLLEHLPNARLVVHPRGATHMIDPAKLITGTIDVYGEKRYREMYGTVTPAPMDRVLVVGDGQTIGLAGRELTCFFAEGHARHHYCIHDPVSSGVFSGDSFGVSYRELDTATGSFIFPSTTPIDFDPVEAHKTIDRIMACEPDRAYLTHYSQVTDLAPLADNLHKGIDFLSSLAITHKESESRKERIADAMFDRFLGDLRVRGYEGDEDRIHAILDFDVRINTMGLEVWLNRMQQN